ncbi:MAG: hypothetical protein Q8Q14_09170 [Gemmatimonadales bacterium]|nr:hypothetical protein [Gemmatimonadales bacterium]
MPIIGPIFRGGTMEMALGVGAGAVVATTFTPMVVGGISRFWAGAANPSLAPLWKLVTGGLAAAIAGMVFRGRKIGNYMLVGGGVAAAIDLLNQYVVPMLPTFAGFRDYVQLPYSGMGGRGMGDYVQLPYSGMGGYGTPYQVEAGMMGLGTPYQVEAGMMGLGFGDDATGTFSQSF